jgi:hypothetical protein
MPLHGRNLMYVVETVFSNACVVWRDRDDRHRIVDQLQLSV